MWLRTVHKSRSIRFEVSDPESGETFWITCRLNGDKLIFRRLGAHMFRGGKTRRQLTVMDKFGKAAQGARGEKMSGKLPSAATRVAAIRGTIEPGGARGESRRGSQRSRVSRETYYRALIGGDEIRRAEIDLRMLGRSD